MSLTLSRAALAVVFAAGVLGGCTSLLGDFADAPAPPDAPFETADGSSGADANGVTTAHPEAGSAESSLPAADASGASDTSSANDASAAESGSGEGGASEGGAAEAGGCAPGELLCNSACVANDLHNCGTCGNDCTHLNNVSATGLACSAGSCVYTCASGFANCDDAGDGCDTNLGQQGNCGGCGVTCAGGAPVCTTNASAQPGCGTGCPSTAPTLCQSTCVDTTSDPSNCNGCNNPCSTTVANANPTCAGSACSYACKPTYTACANGCWDTQNDATHCGSACGSCSTTVMNASPICSAGSCSYACQGGFTSCNNGCYATQSDSNNCGPSCVQCTNGTTCQNGSCQCPVNESACGNDGCQNLQTSGTDCGTCGHSCQGGTCEIGICQPVPVTTASGYVFGMALTTSTIYFSDGSGGHISSCPISGCSAPTVLYTASTFFPEQLLYWPSTNAIVVSDSNHGTIRSVSTSGTLNWTITGQMNPAYLATDGNYLFWGEQGGIGRAYLSSGTTEGSLTTTSGGYPYGIWLDPGSGYVVGAVAGAGVVECTESSACTTVSPTIFNNPTVILVQGGTIYFGAQGTAAKSYSDGGLFSAPINNPTNVTALATGANYAYPLSMTADASYVYFFSFQSYNVYKCALGGCGGAPSEIVAGAGETPSMANDATFVYMGRNGQILKVAK